MIVIQYPRPTDVYWFPEWVERKSHSSPKGESIEPNVEWGRRDCEPEPEGPARSLRSLCGLPLAGFKSSDDTGRCSRGCSQRQDGDGGI